MCLKLDFSNQSHSDVSLGQKRKGEGGGCDASCWGGSWGGVDTVNAVP